MLNSIELLKHKNGEIVIGFDKGDKELNSKAEGNIKGTYGTDRPNPKKARDFLGIKASDLKNILDKYPIKDKEELEDRVQKTLGTK